MTMPEEIVGERNFRLEIGHVLFIDIVGYSKLLTEQQSERLRDLNEPFGNRAISFGRSGRQTCSPSDG